MPRHETLPDSASSRIDRIPWMLAILLCLTLGLAPFAPPHVMEKLQMLSDGSLVKPLDQFDLILHSLPWILLLTKGVRALRS